MVYKEPSFLTHPTSISRKLNTDLSLACKLTAQTREREHHTVEPAHVIVMSQRRGIVDSIQAKAGEVG